MPDARRTGLVSAERSFTATELPPGASGDVRTVARLASMYAEHSTEPTIIAQDTLNRIQACKDRAVFVAVTPGRATREAAASARRYSEGQPLGPLDGVPVAWKDLYDLQDEVTQAGSRVLGAQPASADALLVQRLAAAGAVSVGKLNLVEFAFSGLGLNPNFGTPVNPWSCDEPRIPGGSSSGCGVAVARGLVPIAIGTDTSGSVRVPAALNGVIGFKPSGQRWPLAGCFPLSRTLDTAGVLCRTSSDAGIVDAAARGVSWANPRPARLAGLRVVVPTNVVWDGVEPDVEANCSAGLDRLAQAGVVIDRCAVQPLDAIIAVNASCGTLVALEAYRLHEHRLATDAARMDRRVATRMQQGASIGAEAEAVIRTTRVRLIAGLESLFDGNTLLAFPTVSHTAPLIAPLETDDALFVAMNARTLRNTMLGNFLDWCGISIPTGRDALGLPTALLLSGGPGRDDHLLAVALAAEPLIRGVPAASYQLS